MREFGPCIEPFLGYIGLRDLLVTARAQVLLTALGEPLAAWARVEG